MRSGVDACSQPADNCDATFGKTTRDRTSVGDALRGGSAGAHDSDTKVVVGGPSPQEEKGGRWWTSLR